MRWHQNVTVVEFIDPMVTKEIAQKIPVSEYLLEKAGPNVWVVRSEKLSEFSNELLKHGFKPRILEM